MPALGPAARHADEPAPAGRRGAPATIPSGGGARLGWALAVLGLVAAAVFAGTGEGRQAAWRGAAAVRQRSARVAGWLRPLLGRG